MNVQSIWIKHVFRLKIENSKSTPVHGTIRIFLLPIYDEKHQQYGFDEARTKAIEIDRFVTKCKLIEVIFNHCQLSNIFLAREKKNIPFFLSFSLTRIKSCGSKVERFISNHKLWSNVSHAIRWQRFIGMSFKSDSVCFFLLLLVVVWINTHTTTTEKTHNAQQIEQSIYFDEYNITTTDVICFDYVKLKLIKISI